MPTGRLKADFEKAAADTEPLRRYRLEMGLAGAEHPNQVAPLDGTAKALRHPGWKQLRASAQAILDSYRGDELFSLRLNEALGQLRGTARLVCEVADLWPARIEQLRAEILNMSHAQLKSWSISAVCEDLRGKVAGYTLGEGSLQHYEERLKREVEECERLIALERKTGPRSSGKAIRLRNDVDDVEAVSDGE